MGGRVPVQTDHGGTEPPKGLPPLVLRYLRGRISLREIESEHTLTGITKSTVLRHLRVVVGLYT